VAYDADGGSATSSPVNVTITSPTNKPPAISLATNGTAFVLPASITLTATATDPEDRLAAVDFYAGSVLIARDTTAPYAATWSATNDGSYPLRAVALDADGGTATSNAVNVTITSAAATAPRLVVFTASSDHDTNVTSYRFDVFPSANPLLATPVATADLGKPSPDANNEITSDQSILFNNLALGSYVATVTAIGPGGSSPGATVSFTK
jgi:hypothetical protein